jgi:hypothetical protein
MLSPRAAAHHIISCTHFFCMHVGVGSPTELQIGNKIFEGLYIICDLFWEDIVCHFEMRWGDGTLIY